MLHNWQPKGGEYYDPSTGRWLDNEWQCDRCDAEAAVSEEAPYGREGNAFTEDCPEHRDGCSRWTEDDCNCQEETNDE